MIRKRLGAGKVALLFGSEKVGLSNHDLSHCHWLMRIPTNDRNISMNLGQAVAICLYELARAEAGRLKSAPVASKTAENRASKNRPGKSQPKKNQASESHPGKNQKSSATSGDLERLTQLLFEVLRASDYVKPRTEIPTEEKLRRLVLRMELSAADADQWLGMLRQVAWKLAKDEKPCK